MRILFITSGDRSHPSSRVRVYQFLPAIRRAVGPASVVTMKAPGKWTTRVKQAIAVLYALWADVVVIQYLASPTLARSTMKCCRRVIYDIDDAVYIGHAEMIPVISKFERVIVGNRTLHEYVRKLNPNVTLIPSVVDESRFPIEDRPARRETDPAAAAKPVTIGWIGTDGGFANFPMLKPAFAELHRRFGDRFVFKVVSSRPFDFGPDGPPVQNKLWNLDEEAADIQTFDVGIMPLVDNDWNRNKCAYKAILYMSQGVPAVVTPLGANADVVTDGTDGFHADTTEQWVESLSRLIEDPDLRSKLGRAARQTVRDQYSVAAVLPAMAAALRGSPETNSQTVPDTEIV